MCLICFDLDGTLVDPLRAMEHCARLTCEEFGLPCPTRETLAEQIGLGAWEMFGAIPDLADPARRSEALARYWAHVEEEGIVKHRIYDGISLMLARLKHQGHRLYAVTVKPTRYARQVLHQFDLLLAFNDVCGNSTQAPWKSLGEVFAQLREQGVIKPGGFLIGDRAENMAVAKANGLIPLGVTYGYGSAEELQEAGAAMLFETVAALDDWFKETLRQPEIHDSFSRSE